MKPWIVKCLDKNRSFFDCAWGGKARPDPRLNGRSSHLIEAAKRGRLDQIIFFSAPLTTRAPPGRPAERLAERLAWYGSHQFEETYV